jgi:signal transduction histidine kinase
MAKTKLPEVESLHDVYQMLEKAFEMRMTDISYSINVANQALAKAQINDDTLGQAASNAHLGYFYMILGEHDKARIQSTSAKLVFEEFEHYAGLGMVHYTIGSTYYKTEDYHFGLKHLIDSSLMYQKANDIVGQSRALKAIGSIYEFFREYGHAQETYLKCVELSKQCGDKNGMSNAYNSLSGIYLRNKDLDQALHVIDESIRLKTESGDKRGLAFALYGKAKVLPFLDESGKAELLFLESIEIFDQCKEYVGIMMCHHKLGRLYFGLGKIALAKDHLNKVIVQGNKINHYLIMHKAYYALYEIEKSEKNISAALIHLELYLVHKDKVINKETKNVIESIKSISQMEILEREAHWQKEKKEEVELKNAELDTFVYKVSHDLRGPISSLLGLYEIVQLEIKEKKSLHYFSLYQSQIQRLHGILMDFISLTQIKEMKIEPVKIHFVPMVQECIEAHKYYDNFDQIDFDINIEDIDVNSDKSTINAILQNLIENAIKYARNDVPPKVKIRISSINDVLQIEVADNGIGIKEEYQQRIFEMFFRANDKIQGSGLGLYILKNAVSKLNGSVEFESTVNHGSTFTVSLPL